MVPTGKSFACVIQRSIRLTREQAPGRPIVATIAMDGLPIGTWQFHVGEPDRRSETSCFLEFTRYASNIGVIPLNRWYEHIPGTTAWMSRSAYGHYDYKSILVPIISDVDIFHSDDYGP